MEETWIRTITTSNVFMWKTTQLDITTALVVVRNALFHTLADLFIKSDVKGQTAVG